jgi:predicted enzyme related to lactoylglutathione lyase
MLPRTSYPPGVPCWVDLVQPDPHATEAFYRDLFAWTYEVRTPEGVPQRYAYARLDGQVVAGVGGPPAGTDPTGWTSYVAVASADETAGLVEANGGRVVTGPVDIPRAGRVASCVDPSAAAFGLWQPAGTPGVELVNAPGSWNFTVLEAQDPLSAQAFYDAVFGWEADPLQMGDGGGTWMFRAPGYGDFLAESDPEIRERQALEQAPEGFADAVAMMTRSDDPTGWSVTFAVADADAAFARATELGARVVTPLFDTDYTRQGDIEDPQGAVLTLSEYRPPS